MTNNNENLIAILTEQTQDLLVAFIERTREYAVEMFARYEQAAAKPYPRYADFATPGFVKGKGFASIDYAQGKAFHKAEQARSNACRIVEAGIEDFVGREVILAERHYAGSIAKLAARIEKKGLDQSSLVVATGWVGVNIETTLTDGVKSVKAWTIIASGPCVRPHYRYLIK
jgi:hypothetical protein